MAALIAAAGSLPYIRAIMRGTARPKLVSWFVWMVLAGIMTVSAYNADQRASMLLSLSAFVSCAIVVALGWRQGKVELTKIDIVCLSGAVAGIGSLIVLRDPFIALAISVGVDMIAYVPTLIHGWYSPDEESLACFAFAVLAAGISLGVALYVHASLTGLMYPVYALVFNGIMTAILLIGRMTPRTEYQYEADEA